MPAPCYPVGAERSALLAAWISKLEVHAERRRGQDFHEPTPRRLSPFCLPLAGGKKAHEPLNLERSLLILNAADPSQGMQNRIGIECLLGAHGKEHESLLDANHSTQLRRLRY